jgi:hypothetical protein
VTWVRRDLVASVTDLLPGNLQGVVLGEDRLVHVHAPSYSHPENRVTRACIFREAAPLFVAESRNLPIMIGDFNCV